MGPRILRKRELGQKGTRGVKTFEQLPIDATIDRFSEQKQMINFELNDFYQEATFSGVA
jgi:hypothetical protein